MYLYACFDVEDLVHPDSDDIAMDIANVLAADGMVGSMFVVGEKARLWEQRGRTDVISAVGYHDVGFHTNTHSIHPTIAEYLAERGWEDGVAEAVRQEEPGVRDLARLFGRYPSAWATPGSSWGPQIPAAMRKIGVPATVYAQVRAGEGGACWFAGEFCYADFIYFPGGEDSYTDDATFETALPKLLAEVNAAQRRGMACLGLFVAHPTKLRYTQFWDTLNYNRGQNTSPAEYRFAPRRTDEQYQTSLRNLRRLMLALRDLPGVEVIGMSDLTHRFAVENHPLPMAATRELAQMALDQGMMGTENPVASPAQSLDVLARAVLTRAAGASPAYLPLRTVLGPLERPPELAAPLRVTGEAALAICQTLRDYITQKGHLPTALEVAGTRIGPGALLRGIAALLLEEEANPNQAQFTTGAEEPLLAGQLAEEGIYQQLPGWPPHDPNLRLDQLALHVRLQSWSLKPAVLSS
jgi:hypothetical protein